MIRMKKILGKTIGPGIVIITALAFLGLTPKAYALTIPSEDILMIDGQGDGNTTVSILAIDLLPGVEFGHMIDDEFDPISSDVLSLKTFPGNTIVDFAIHDAASGETMAASEGNATMEFWGSIAADNSENPVVDFDYWRGVNIWWTQDWFPDDILISVESYSDGIAPAYHTAFNPGSEHSVPDASIMFLLGPALLVLGVIGRRKSKK